MGKNVFGFGVRELKLYEITDADTEGSLPVYGEELPVGTTNAIRTDYDTASATACGDDATVADISTVTGVKLSWTGWDAPFATKAHIYGHKMYEDGALDESTGDSAPYIGVSYIRTLLDDSSMTIYEAVAVYKSRATKENEENQTKSNSLNLGSTPIKFSGVETLNGHLLTRKQFSDKDRATALKNARQWLASIFAPKPVKPDPVD